MLKDLKFWFFYIKVYIKLYKIKVNILLRWYKKSNLKLNVFSYFKTSIKRLQYPVPKSYVTIWPDRI